jgi:2-phosphosulfolactate phosphatase
VAASLSCLGATVDYIRTRTPSVLILVSTGRRADGRGDEDVACAEAIEGALRRAPLDPDELARRLRESRAGRRFDGSDSAFPFADLTCAVDIDRFDFSMIVTRRDRLKVVRRLARVDGH